MTNENAPDDVQLAANFDNIVGIARKIRVLRWIVGLKIGLTAANMVE
ncbi:hypothetical protein SS05631_b51000 (plasmid) [Sinorhizobium sp. CCBAU 05631]|nr:hypothetical protein SS05631_b51000 [Sinorhizobium sp. CCBAU 05631]